MQPLTPAQLRREAALRPEARGIYHFPLLPRAVFARFLPAGFFLPAPGRSGIPAETPVGIPDGIRWRNPAGFLMVGT